MFWAKIFQFLSYENETDEIFHEKIINCKTKKVKFFASESEIISNKKEKLNTECAERDKTEIIVCAYGDGFDSF